jgi:hypothetical protein
MPTANDRNRRNERKGRDIGYVRKAREEPSKQTSYSS